MGIVVTFWIFNAFDIKYSTLIFMSPDLLRKCFDSCTKGNYIKYEDRFVGRVFEVTTVYCKVFIFCTYEKLMKIMW